MDRRYLERIWGTDFAAIHIWRNWSDCNLISFKHKLHIKKEILKTSYIIFFFISFDTEYDQLDFPFMKCGSLNDGGSVEASCGDV